MADHDDNLGSEEMATSSDSEDERITSLIDDDEDDAEVRYSLRSRRVPKAGTAASDASAGVKDAAELRATTTSSITNVRTEALYPPGARTTGMDVQTPTYHARVTAGGGLQDVEDGSEERRKRLLTVTATSPFELTSARGWTTDRRVHAPERRAMDERMTYTDVGRTRTQDGSRMPPSLSFDRRDMLYTSTMSQGVRMPCVTSSFTTRMTSREQPRIELDVNVRSRTTAEDSPAWLEYQ